MITQLVLTAILLSMQAHAMMGVSAQRGAPQAVCRLVKRDPVAKTVSLCSGTLVDAQHVLTAAHCFDREGAAEQLSIECGSDIQVDDLVLESIQSGAADVGFAVRGVRFSETHRAAQIEVGAAYSPAAARKKGDATDDIARVTLATPSKLTAIPLSTDQKLSSCRAAGFGISIQGQAMGIPFTAPLDSPLVQDNRGTLYGLKSVVIEDIKQAEWIRGKTLRFISQNPAEKISDAEMLLTLEETGQFAMLMAPGDSGGPLYCQDPSGALRVYAVNEGFFPVLKAAPSDVSLMHLYVLASHPERQWRTIWPAPTPAPKTPAKP